jgi:hypothetical protein
MTCMTEAITADKDSFENSFSTTSVFMSIGTMAYTSTLQCRW